MSKRKLVASATALLVGVTGAVVGVAAPAAADGANGEVRGYLWPDVVTGAPNWAGTFRMPDGTEAWCADYWAYPPKYASGYGAPTLLTKNDGSALTAQQLRTIAYAVGEGSEVVINKAGTEADDYAAAVSIIVHSLTNAIGGYSPDWPLAAFDKNLDPNGTGQQTTQVRAVYDKLLADVARYGGAWSVDLDAPVVDPTIGDDIEFTGLLETTGGTPIPGRELRIVSATGIALSSATVTTAADGTFAVAGEVTATDVSVTVERTSPSDTVMMRKATGWTPPYYPQNMIVVDSAKVAATASVTARAATPSIGTSASDQADGDRVLPWYGGTIVDAVAYENLTPGAPYTVTGELRDKATGAGTGIVGEASFTAPSASGTVEVTFSVPEGFAGSALVVFERLYDADGTLVASHEDLGSAEQTVTVEQRPGAPSIGTSASDQADGDRVLPWTGGSVVDVVSYENLTPGAEYTLTGELMDATTGAGTGIVGTTTFTPSSPSGTAEVTFTVPEGYAGSSLVVFERLYDADAALVAVHEDIDAQEQTVTVEAAPATPTTPGGLAITGVVLPIGAVALGLGLAAAGVLLVMRRRAAA